MDLFENKLKQVMEKEQPLAARMRPKTLDDFIGQENIIGKGRLLYRAIKADQISSLIFYGPPGTGKTTLASVIANTTKSNFITINAVLSGVKDIREAIKEAKEKRELYSKRTILFVDEVHRWNKAQQDALLPWVENGTVILIGATTENPFFEVNRALVSRSRVFQLKILEEKDLKRIVFNALENREYGYGNIKVKLDEDALNHLVKVSAGDARSILNALELAVETTPEVFPPADSEEIHITLDIAEDSIQKRAVLYDKEGDYHFDTISAFIKSLRGSDPDAALYWLAKMIYAGEDPRFMFRRMLIFACEDIGLADPNALVVTEAAASAFDRVGLPEGRYHLASAVLYLANAPKSNSVMAFFDALNTVENEKDHDVPKHLKDASRDKNAFGHGEGYLYPHSYREHWIAQQYLPKELQGKMFYKPGNTGYEAQIKEKIERRREMQLAAFIESREESEEILTFSPPDKNKDLWLSRAAGNISRYMKELRDRYFENISIPRHFACLDLSGDTHLFIWELLRKVPEGNVWTVALKQYEAILELTKNIHELNKPVILNTGYEKLKENILLKENITFDLITGRNILLNGNEKILNDLSSVLSENGIIYLIEPAPYLGQKMSDFIKEINSDILIKFKKNEDDLFNILKNKFVTCNSDSLKKYISVYKLKIGEMNYNSFVIKRKVLKEDIDKWFNDKTGLYYSVKKTLKDNEIKSVKKLLYEKLLNNYMDWKITAAFIKLKKQ